MSGRSVMSRRCGRSGGSGGCCRSSRIGRSGSSGSERSGARAAVALDERVQLAPALVDGAHGAGAGEDDAAAEEEQTDDLDVGGSVDEALRAGEVRRGREAEGRSGRAGAGAKQAGGRAGAHREHLALEGGIDIHVLVELVEVEELVGREAEVGGCRRCSGWRRHRARTGRRGGACAGCRGSSWTRGGPR
jgi:hypothetical protein